MNRIDMARVIVNWEARRDGYGRLVVYKLPANDGGGSFEVAGINERYDPVQARELRRLVESGRDADAEAYAADYIAQNTDIAASWLTQSLAQSAIEFFLRDTVFNRGAGGAAKVLQMAVGAGVDGQVGPATRARLAEFDRRPLLLLARLRGARERYEREVIGVRDNFWQGLVNRWDKAFEKAAALIT